MRLHGRALRLNARTEEGGSIRVEIQDETWTPLENHVLNQSTPITGNHLDAPVTWGPTSRLTTTANNPVVLRFQLRRANLFGFEVVA